MNTYLRQNIRPNQAPVIDFGAYLKQSTYDPFTINLRGKSLMEVIQEAIKVKSRRSPNYARDLTSLIKQLKAIENEYGVVLRPIQITDIFWDNFIAICLKRGLKPSSIETITNQLRAILNWAIKHGAEVSPTYQDARVPKYVSQEIALSADELSRIKYFDIDSYYRHRRPDFRETMRRVRDMFMLSTCLFQRHSDCVRITKSCFDRNIFRIVQEKTHGVAIVNIDKYSADPKAAYEILERYNWEAPYKSDLSNYNRKLHQLMRDIGFTEKVRIDEPVNGTLTTKEIPKWKMISSHTSRRTATTIAVLRGHNLHAIRKCTGHQDLRVLDRYIRDDD